MLNSTNLFSTIATVFKRHNYLLTKFRLAISLLLYSKQKIGKNYDFVRHNICANIKNYIYLSLNLLIDLFLESDNMKATWMRVSITCICNLATFNISIIRRRD